MNDQFAIYLVAEEPVVVVTGSHTWCDGGELCAGRNTVLYNVYTISMVCTFKQYMIVCVNTGIIIITLCCVGQVGLSNCFVCPSITCQLCGT